MCEMFKKLPVMYQGLIYVGSGIIIALYALGLITKGINLVVIGFACFLIVVGLVKIGLYDKVMKASHKK